MRREDVMDIEKLAKEASANGSTDELTGDAILRFAQAVRRETLEEAAKVAERTVEMTVPGHGDSWELMANRTALTLRGLADKP